MSNTVAVGAVLGMLGMSLEELRNILEETFKKKGSDIVEANIRAAEAGYSYAKKECLTCSFNVSEKKTPRMLISGNEAVALSAIASGLKFYSGYPMTPSTGMLNFVSEKAKDFGIVVEQAEDEISAINMIIGASFAGVRSMTGTSGGGFALMVEALSLAGMTETPIVIALGQRPGPATGLPTRTEQGELLFALFAGHGEFPKIVFAPGTPEQAFYLTNKAFELAEKHQVISIILTDQHLADSQWTFDSFDTDRLIYTNYRLTEKELNEILEYKRHAFTDSGVSPFAVPGKSKHLVITDSDEHDEYGHLEESMVNRCEMVEKRYLKKMGHIKKEISPPVLYGHNHPEVLLICWGPLYGVVREVVDRIKDRKAAMLHFSEIYPFSDDDSWMEYVHMAEHVINIEQNAGSQFAKLMRMEKGIQVEKHINRWNGRPFTVEELEEMVYEQIR